MLLHHPLSQTFYREVNGMLLFLCQQEKYDSSCDANDIDESDYSRRKVMQNYFYGQQYSGLAYR